MTKVTKFRLTIGAKLIGVIAILLMASVASLVWLSTRLFIEDNTALIQKMNADTAASLATQMRELFQNTTEKMRMLGTVLIQDLPADKKQRLIREFFVKDKDFIGVFIHQHTDASARVMQKAVAEDVDSEGLLEPLNDDKNFSLSTVATGESLLTTMQLPDGSPAVIVAVPFIEGSNGKFSHTILAVLKQERFVKAFGESDVIISFMVDRKGKLLAHPDASRVAAGESAANLGIVKQLLEGKFNNGQTRYVEPQTGEVRIGAYRMVGFAGLGVVAEVPEEKAFEAARRVTLRSMYVAGIILSLSFLIGYIFSGTITWPIKHLAEAALKISNGDFSVHLKPKTNDEIADLSFTFNEMAKGLEERDKVKATFNKFHSSEIAEKLLSGEVNLGGERRVATIFFSDVRGFTGMSETMSPEDVVVMLNEYMTRMVSVIRKYSGVVDKYVGDAIMALWGVPLGGPDDVTNCIMACIEMRAELNELNKLRLSRGQSALKIGMGVNTGPVIAGNIGSEEKMEYTVIGDSVNLASRIESLTKEYGTDLLISSNTYNLVKDRFIFEECKVAKVKGKSEGIQVFKVKGFINANGEKVIVETPYSSYASEKSDKVVHDEPAAVEPQAEDNSSVALNLQHTQMIQRPNRDEWYINADGQVYGPFTKEEVIAGINAQEIDLSTMATKALDQPWQALSDFPDFKQAA
ncbi:MAG: adenylate/guanylate cyclase domain-containing protein [Bacteriovoracia bacterium]